MDTSLVVKVLRTVPAKNLKLIQIVNELVDANGNLDSKLVAERDGEITLAKIEAEAYANATLKAITALAHLKPITGGLQ